MHYDGDIGVEVTGRLEEEKQENRDIEKGIPLTDNVILRLTSKKDLENLSVFPNTAKSVTPYCLNRYVLECSFHVPKDSEIMSDADGKMIELIKNTITALRLLKKGYIDSNCIFRVPTKDSQGHTGLRFERIIPNPSLYEGYYLRTDELIPFKNLLEKIIKIDFDKEKRLKVALRRFENSYFDVEVEDKLIDYMIAFEALFTEITDWKKREIIAKNSARLLGKDKADKRQMKEILLEAYRLRNKIVHGEDLKINDENTLEEEEFFSFEDFVGEVEELLRKTIKTIIGEVWKKF